MELNQTLLDKMMAKTQKTLTDRPKGGGNFPKLLKRDTIPTCVNKSDPGAILRVVYPSYLKDLGFLPWIESRTCTLEYASRQFATFHSPGFWGRPDLDGIQTLVDDLLASGDKGEVDLGNRLRYRPAFYLPVVNMRAVGDGVQFLSCSAALFEAFFTYLGDRNLNNERAGYIWDPERGANFIVRRFGAGLKTEWSATLERGSSVLPDAETLQAQADSVNIFDLITLDPTETFITAYQQRQYDFKEAMAAAREFMESLTPFPLPKLLPSGRLFVPDALLEAWESEYVNPDAKTVEAPRPAADKAPEPAKPAEATPARATRTARKPSGPTPDNPESYRGLTIKFQPGDGPTEIGEVTDVVPSSEPKHNGALMLLVDTGDGGDPWEVAPGKVLEIVDTPKPKAPDPAPPARRSAALPEAAPATSPVATKDPKAAVADVMASLRAGRKK